MLNYLWGFMIIIGVIYGAFTGNVQAVADGAIECAKDAITLCITMLGVMSLWTGLMEIAEKYGKNALLRGTSYLDAATQRERNEMIGGHRAGYDDPSRTR